MGHTRDHRYDVAIIGAGNMGMAIAGAMLQRNRSVIIIDKDQVKIDCLTAKHSPVPEENIEKLLWDGDFLATTNIERIVDAYVIYIAVETPAMTGQCDYLPLRRVLEQVSAHRRADQGVVIGSTVYPGGFKKLGDYPNMGFKNAFLAYHPVFLRAGTGIADYQNPGKVIFGVADPLNEPGFLAPFKHVSNCQHTTDYVLCSREEAEWIKMVHNSFMCLKVAYANELADVMKKHGIQNPNAIMSHTFVEKASVNRLFSMSHLRPGPPYSGTCLPKDAEILTGLLPLSDDYQVLHALEDSNTTYLDRVFESWIDQCARGAGVIGLTYRPGFNELRRALSTRLFDMAISEDLPIEKLWGYDPVFVHASDDVVKLAARGDSDVLRIKDRIVFDLGQVWINCDSIVINKKLAPSEIREIEYARRSEENLKLNRPKRNVIDLFSNNIEHLY